MNEKGNDIFSTKKKSKRESFVSTLYVNGFNSVAK